MNPNAKTRVRRAPKRGLYEKEQIYAILDKECTCHISFVYEGYPVTIPTLYGRSGDQVFFHGASVSRMLKTLEKGVELCLAVTRVNGLVLARSAFHHSMNYESVVLFGTASLVEGWDEKMEALKVISDHIIPGRWEEVRGPSEVEMKATKVLAMTIDEGSAKARVGAPSDDKPDYELDIWAGVVPVESRFGAVIPDPVLREGIPVPESVKGLMEDQSAFSETGGSATEDQ